MAELLNCWIVNEVMRWQKAIPFLSHNQFQHSDCQAIGPWLTIRKFNNSQINYFFKMTYQKLPDAELVAYTPTFDRLSRHCWIAEKTEFRWKRWESSIIQCFQHPGLPGPLAGQGQSASSAVQKTTPAYDCQIVINFFGRTIGLYLGGYNVKWW